MLRRRLIGRERVPRRRGSAPFPARLDPRVDMRSSAPMTSARRGGRHGQGGTSRPTPGGPMRTLHLGLRVTDLERSLAFYTALGYEVVGEVPETGIGHLTMLKLPDDEFVTIELVHQPGTDVPAGSGLSHVVIAV